MVIADSVTDIRQDQGLFLFTRAPSLGVKSPLHSLTDFERLGSQEKLGSNLGQLAAENRVKAWSVTQSQAKRINEIVFPLFFRDQGVGGSNPLAPTNLQMSLTPIFPPFAKNAKDGAAKGEVRHSKGGPARQLGRMMTMENPNDFINRLVPSN